MSDPWWPPLVDDPAFQVRRQSYSLTQGGDYVRGSQYEIKGTLSGAATPLPTSPEIGDTWLLDAPLPTAAPAPVTGIPATSVKAAGQAIRWDGTDWINLGVLPAVHQTVLRYPTTEPGYEDVEGKAYLTIRWYGHETVSVKLPPDSENLLPRDIIQPIGVAEIAWGWPISLESNWDEVALIRSGFGRPVTVTDGVTVFRATQASFIKDGVMTPPPVVYDRPLQVGRYFYYSLFFRTTQLDWVLGMSEEVLIPRDYKHADHLWNTIPPWYRYTDDNLRTGSAENKLDGGPLLKYLTLFGWELDRTREYVEQWQNVYNIDKSPMSLLRKVGDNFGVPYKAAVGDVRYRSMLAALPQLLLIRGTSAALEGVIEAGSKWLCGTTIGPNLMLLVDDSTFRTGPGNWGTQHTGAGVGWDYLTANEVIIKAGPNTGGGNTPSAPYGEKSMRVQTINSKETANFGISCGCIFRLNEADPPDVVGVYPRTAGIAIHEGFQYGFTVQVYAEAAVTVRVALLWFGKGGYPTTYLSKSEKATTYTATNKQLTSNVATLTIGTHPLIVGNSIDVTNIDAVFNGTYTITAIAATTVSYAKTNANVASTPIATGTVTRGESATVGGWKNFFHQGVAPPGAIYMCPALYFTGRAAVVDSPERSGFIDLAGAMVYEVDQVSVPRNYIAPDKFFTLGDAEEVLGVETEIEGDEVGGYILGNPRAT